MAVSLDELNAAAKWETTADAAKKIPTPVTPLPMPENTRTVSLDEVNAFSEHIVTNRDAPKSFWQRRMSDVSIAFDQAPHTVGSALIFLGKSIRGKEAPPIDPAQDTPFLKDFAEKLQASKATGGAKDLIGTAFIRMGLSWQDMGEKFVEQHSKGMENQTPAEDYLGDVVKMGTGMAGLIGTAYVAGPLVATGSFVGPAFFDTYAKAQAKGKSYDDSVKIAGAMGIAVGTPAFLGLGAIMKLSGPAIERMVTASVIGGVDMTVMRGGSEMVERISGITDSQAKGWDSVKEAVGLAVRDGSIGAIIGPVTAGISFAMQKRTEVKEKLREIGMPDEQAIKTTDALFSKGMDKVLSVVEQEHALIKNNIFRDENGSFVDQHGRPVSPERVIATKASGDIESLPLVEKAKVVASEALPQRETVGITAEEKAFLDATPAKPVEDLPKNVVQALTDKFLKIDAKLKFREGITSRVKSEAEVNIENQLTDIRSKAATRAVKLTRSLERTKRLQPLWESKLKNTLSGEALKKALMVQEFNVEGKKFRLQRSLDRLATRTKLRTSRLEAKLKKMGAEIVKADLKSEAGLRTSSIELRAKLQAVQKELIDFVLEGGLQLKDEAKFLTSIKNAQTVQQLRRQLPVIRERIAQMREKGDLNAEIGRFKDLTAESVIKKTRPEFQKEIRSISSGLSATKMSAPQAMKLESLAQFLAKEPNAIIPQHKLDELASLEKKSLRDMTSSEVQLINDALTHLYKLNELKTSILEKNKYVSLEKTVNEIVGNIKSGSVKRTQADPVVSGLETTISRGEQVKNWLGLDSRDAETNLLIVEGKDGGVFQSVIFGGLNRAKTDYLRYATAAKSILREGTKDIDVSKWSQYITADAKKLDMQVFKFTGSGKSETVKLTKAQMIAFHLLSLRKEGLNHLLGGGFSFRGKEAKVIKVTEADVEMISSAVLKDPEMLQVAMNLDAYFNGFQKHAINKTSLRLNGIELATTPNYFRIVANHLFYKVEPSTRQYQGKVAIEGLGFLKETVPSKLPIILEDAFQVAYESIHLSGSYVAYAEPLRAAKTVLVDSRVKQELNAQGRGEFLKSFERYVQRVEGEVTDLTNLEALSRDLITKIQTSVLMLNPGILLKQPTSVLAASTEMRGLDLAKNYKVIASKEEVAEIQKWSPQLAARWDGHITRELGELKNSGAIQELFTGRVGWNEKFMQAYQTMDHPMVTSVWRTAKAEIKAENPDLTGSKFFEGVAERAEFVVRRTQASVFMEHRSENLAKRDLFSRGLSLFSSETNKQFSMVSRAVEEFSRSKKTLSDRAILGKKLFIVSYLNSVLIATINLGVNVWKQSPDKGRDDEEEKDWKLIADKFWTDVVLGPLGMFYGVRDIANGVQSMLVYGDITHEINNPVTALATDIAKGIGQIAQSGVQLTTGEEFSSGPKKDEEKWTSTLKSAILDLLSAIGAASGKPVRNVLQYGGPMFTEVEKLFGE